jgi:PAS domain S-box-containing protein
MFWQFNAYIVVYFLTAAVSAGVAAYAWHRRTVPGAAHLAWLMAAGAEWALAAGFEAAAVGVPAKVFWSKVEYLGFNSSPVLFLLFALAYSRPGRPLGRRATALIWVIPALTFLLAATNEWHRLVWNSFTPSPAGGNILIYGHGIWFYVAIAYFYLAAAAGAIVIIRAAVRLARPYRRQAIALLVAAAMPILIGAIYVTGLSPVPGLDIPPIGFMFAGLALAWGIFQFRLLDLAPVARDLLFESMSDGVVVLDAQNRIVDINRAGQRLLGATAAVIGQRAGALLTARPDLIERFRNVIEGQAEIVLGTEVPRHLDLRISPLYDRHRRFTGRLIVLRDITERKQAEEELYRSNEELRARNAELDAYAHTVAHDLKNPLGLLSGYAELLMENSASLSPDELREYAHTISEHTSKMSGIINGLLLLASARQAQVENSPLDMAAIVAEVQRRLAREIQEHRAEIVVPESWPTALGYRPWVEEVWANYLSNALKYGGRPDATPPIPPWIELSAAVQDDGYVRFTVRDNGHGIVPEAQEQLFVPFSRLGQSGVTGHGLGLSIVQRIVERLGGQVGVESVVGKGSTFYFTLPRADL